MGRWFKMYRTVKELTKDELEELRSNYYYNVLNDIDEPSEVLDNTIFEYYDGTQFVADDFFCNQ